MVYIPDLSPYPITEEYRIWGTVSIGWLTAKVPFPHGQVPEEFIDRLFLFCLNPVLRTRGFHTCEFCSPPPPFLVYAQMGNKRIGLGSAEIRVIYQGRVYAAPDMIYHYVMEHQYRPPEEFIEAVLQGPLPDSAEYQTFLEKWQRTYENTSQG